MVWGVPRCALTHQILKAAPPGTVSLGKRTIAAYAVFFLRSAHRFFIISDIRFRAAGLIFRRPADGFDEGLAAFLRLSAHLAFAASDIRLRPAALIRRRGFATDMAALGTAPA
jgi:hypothetical protein